MKAKPDYTIAIEIILLGILLLIGYYFSSSLQNHPLGYFWFALSIITLSIGFWKIESYEITGSKITNKNFTGIMSKSADLKNLKQESTKNHKTHTSPFLFIGLFKIPINTGILAK